MGQVEKDAQPPATPAFSWPAQADVPKRDAGHKQAKPFSALRFRRTVSFRRPKMGHARIPREAADLRDNSPKPFSRLPFQAKAPFGMRVAYLYSCTGESMIRTTIVADVFRYVVQLPEERLAGLTIKTLAEHFAVSRCHLSRAFRSDRGMTLTTFIKRQKLLRAERLLIAGRDVSVRELGLRLGYADYQHFITRFKEQWGESPGRYRKLFSE
jgi:AraC-like DNA-binding protein